MIRTSLRRLAYVSNVCALRGQQLNCRRFSTAMDVDDISNDSYTLPVSFEDISRAQYRISSGIRRTHCDRSNNLSDICDTTVFIKKDFTQFTGRYKISKLMLCCVSWIHF